MIKVANILPNNCINENMPRQRVEMYLCHKILEDPERFAFLANDDANNIECYKILDNSACELGEGLQLSDVLKAAKVIKASEVVLPDIPRSGKSLCKTLRYLDELPQDVPYSIAAVVQGDTEEEVLACAEQILMLRRVNTIMIPKWYCGMNSSNGLGRHRITSKIIQMMFEVKTPKRIHWLGLDTGLRELVTPLAQVVRSVDTGYLAALSTPQWSHLNVFDDRPRELKINLQQMDVDIDRWRKLVDQQQRLIEGELINV